MKPIIIGIMVSSPSIHASLKKLTEQRDIVIKVSYKALDSAVAAARRMAEEGVEVFIGRRGMAHLLRESLAVPVLSLPTSSLNEIAKPGTAVAGQGVRRPIRDRGPHPHS